MAPPPLVEIDPDAPIPAYRQIASALRRHLVEGRVKAGDLLPPIRQLALDLGVNFNTVAQAYRLLADEGWLDLKRRRGALVIHRSTPVAPDSGQIDRLVGRLQELTAEFRSAGMTRGQIAVALRRLAKGV
jgi:DNA-binding transcriptional regulator YhcF (GntR family)